MSTTDLLFIIIVYIGYNSSSNKYYEIPIKIKTEY